MLRVNPAVAPIARGAPAINYEQHCIDGVPFTLRDSAIEIA